MSSVTQALSRWFGNKNSVPSDERKPAQARLLRHSTGLTEFTRIISAVPGLSVLDLGPTSPANIKFLTDLGHKVYNEDVLSEASLPELQVKGEDGTVRLDVDTYLKYNLLYQPQSLDAVLLWSVPDFLHEALVKPMMDRLSLALRPKGIVLGFFHSKDAAPTPHYRYQISDGANGMMELRAGKPFKLQRVFNNRHIENLFHDFRSCKFFLSQDNLREVLVTR